MSDEPPFDNDDHNDDNEEWAFLEWLEATFEDEHKIPQGMKLLHILRGHESWIGQIAWSPDGHILASPSVDKTIRLWNPATGQIIQTLQGHTSTIYSVTWSPDGQALASASVDKTIKLWNPATGQTMRTLQGHLNNVWSVAWSPDGQTLASASDDKTIKLWNPATGQTMRTLQGHTSSIHSVAWSPDGQTLASASDDKTIRLWNPATGQTMRTLQGHTSSIYSVAWSPDGQTLTSPSIDRTIRLWNPATGQTIRTIEGYTSSIRMTSFSSDGRLLISKGVDGIRLWRCDTWEPIATFKESGSAFWPPGCTFHPTHPHILATVGGTNDDEEKRDIVIYIWELDIPFLLGQAPSPEAVGYTNSRVVLVGDTGVGKSGLALALMDQPWVPTESTHARKIYTFRDEIETLPNGLREQRETLLWDLAGQPAYRIIHQLQLVEVAVALLCFDSRGSDPFSSVRYWNKALNQALKVQGDAAVPMCKLLIAARADRGGIPVSQERIDELVDELGLDGFFETSAKEGWSIAELKAAILENIDWDALPKVSSTEIFVSIKDFLTHTKQQSTLLIPTTDTLYALYQASEYAPEDDRDVRAEFETVIGRVESRGLIRRLSFGGFVLLQPELLDSYASSMVFAARDEPDGLGCISETIAREGLFRIAESERIDNAETEKLLLIATVEDLLRHEIALKDEGDLIFPSQFLRERPDLPDPEGKAVVFTFEGAVQNIYTRLAVRLSRSDLFRREDMWRNAATYTPGIGSCGMWLRELPEGAAELTLFYTPETGEETRFHFEQYVEAMLSRLALRDTLTRRRMFVCSNCGETMNDRHVQARRERGHNTMVCPVCDNTIYLLDREERLETVPESKVREIDQAADRGRDLAVAEYTVMGKKEVDDFDVFLCHNSDDKPAIREINKTLKDSGLLPWLDEEQLRPGFPWQRILEKQIGNIKSAAVFVGENGRGPWQNMELEAFLREFVDRQFPVIPVILPDCRIKPDLPIFLRGMTWVDFRDPVSNPLQRLIWGITGERGRF